MGKVSEERKEVESKAQAEELSVPNLSYSPALQAVELIDILRESIPAKRMRRTNIKSYSVEDILATGKTKFFGTVSPKGPLHIPSMVFTEEEKHMMDEIIEQGVKE